MEKVTGGNWQRKTSFQHQQAKRDEGLLKEELGTLAHREKAAEHAVNVVSAGQIVDTVITMASNSNSFVILNYRFTFLKSLVNDLA